MLIKTTDYKKKRVRVASEDTKAVGEMKPHQKETSGWVSARSTGVHGCLWPASLETSALQPSNIRNKQSAWQGQALYVVETIKRKAGWLANTPAIAELHHSATTPTKTLRCVSS